MSERLGSLELEALSRRDVAGGDDDSVFEFDGLDLQPGREDSLCADVKFFLETDSRLNDVFVSLDEAGGSVEWDQFAKALSQDFVGRAADQPGGIWIDEIEFEVLDLSRGIANAGEDEDAVEAGVGSSEEAALAFGGEPGAGKDSPDSRDR